VVRRDVPREAEASGESFEAYARAVRYAFLQRTAQERGCGVIATGHHADDQTETILLRLLRGASPDGLGGIPPVRPMGPLRIVRPLIDCTRGDLLAWLRAEGHAWREDGSNADPRYLRNRVRHELLPQLESYNPSVREALTRLAETQRCESACLDVLAREAGAACREGDRLDRAAFRHLHEALQRRVLLQYCFDLGVAPSHDLLIQAGAAVAGCATGKEWDLGQGVLLYLGRTHVEPARSATPKPEAAVPLAVPGTTEALGFRFRAKRLESVPYDLAAHCNPWRQVFDAGLMGDTVVRTRRPGDVFRPLGMKGHRKLKNWFIDAGVPRPARDTRPMLARGETILWVVGGPPSADVAVTEATTSCLEVEVDHAD
jgi:tRNA(Ile)-lysidine synthase